MDRWVALCRFVCLLTGVTATALTTSLFWAAAVQRKIQSEGQNHRKDAHNESLSIPRIKSLAALAVTAAASSDLYDTDALPNPEVITRLNAMFALPLDRLKVIVKQIISDMKTGLERDGGAIKMLPTFVTKRPSGRERGSYLAIDFGGTNLRVCELVLNGHAGEPQLLQSKFQISENVKTGSGSALFDFIAECVRSFFQTHHALDAHDWNSKRWQLGFTFSFPVDQISIKAEIENFDEKESANLSTDTSFIQGTLITWTKGFTATNVIDRDSIRLLEDAFERMNLNIEVTALVNDTTGTLISHAYQNPDTYAGVILGTGSNCAYVEKFSNITKFRGPPPPLGTTEMLINMEWGGFDDAQVVIPRTKYDLLLDRNTPTPGSYTFEQLISGMYIGEIVRLVVLDLARTGDLFAKATIVVRSPLHKQYGFETSYMSRIERDHSFDLADVKALLEGDEFEIVGTTLADRKIIKAVCEMIGLRSARLAAAGVCAVVTKMNKLNGCTIGIDGSLFEKYPHYPNRMRDAMREILGISSENILLEQAKDGSGQGAGLIAALAAEAAVGIQ
ncbi:hexokinase A [Physocladia obscura]|uniref:Phosphotransferase n=1 Tax=Physocladia obscura TaxID=109957 RepID=A0AAD5SW00_9FUNG|nr:hexokinase A [Physocladia obscura]